MQQNKAPRRQTRPTCQSGSRQTSVAGPAVLSFSWKVSSEQGYDFLKILVDGVERDRISGEVDWQRRVLVVPSGSHTIQWAYQKDTAVIGGADRAWVDQVQLSQGMSLATALDAPEMAWESGGDVPWFGETAITHDGSDAAQSGSITNNQTSWVETAVVGPGLLSYWWKGASSLSVDGVERWFGQPSDATGLPTYAVGSLMNCVRQPIEQNA